MRVVIPQIAWHTRDPVLTLDFDPKGKSELGYYRIASGGADNLLLIWHLSNPDSIKPEIICVSELKRHQKAINVCRFSPCGNYLASGDDDSYVFIWKNETETDKEETWTVEKIFRRHVEDVSDLCWSSDSNYLISGSVDNTAVLWDVRKGSVLHFWSEREHTGFVQGVAYDPLGELCATICIDRNLRFFKTKDGKVAHKSLKYPPAWLGITEEDETKENTPEIMDQKCGSSKSVPLPEANQINGDVVVSEEKDMPLSEVNGLDEEETKPSVKKPVTTLNRLFHDDTLKTFCRRLSYSPRGELLMVPGGLLPPVEKKKDQSRQSTPVDDEDSKEKVAKKIDSEQNNAVIIFCRNSWTNPCAVIPTGLSYSIAARFNPVYYEKERQPYNYDPDFVNSTKKCERIVSCVGKLRPPQLEKPVLLDMPYRLVYAIATNDSVLIGDTSSMEPLACIRNIHCTRMTDLSWSPDGLVLIASSTDGYCSIVTFNHGELGAPYKVDEFPHLTPTCFPIAPPEPKPVKKKESKEPKDPVEKKEKKEKEPSTPVETKDEKKKKTLTIKTMLEKSRNNHLAPLKQKSPIKPTEQNQELVKSPEAERIPVAPALSSQSSPAALTPKPTKTMLDWVKITPKSCTPGDSKQPRRIQLNTIQSSVASPTPSESVPADSKQPRRIQLTTISSSATSPTPSESVPADSKQPRRIQLTTIPSSAASTLTLPSESVPGDSKQPRRIQLTTIPSTAASPIPSKSVPGDSKQPRRIQLTTIPSTAASPVPSESVPGDSKEGIQLTTTPSSNPVSRDTNSLRRIQVTTLSKDTPSPCSATPLGSLHESS